MRNVFSCFVAVLLISQSVKRMYMGAIRKVNIFINDVTDSGSKLVFNKRGDTC